MIKEVYKNIFYCEVPLPKSPLKAINNYVILGGERPLIIDSAFNTEECRQSFYGNIKELNVDISKSDVLITHLHADHSGLTGELYEQGAKIYTSLYEGNTVQDMSSKENIGKLKAICSSLGFKDKEDFFDRHPAKVYSSRTPFEFTVLEEGDFLNVGEYNLKVISVPGHTPAMLNLFDEKHKVYFAADHILERITPNISYWGAEYPNILNTFFESLDKVYKYDIDLMLPAHRDIILDHKKRITELKDHHKLRLDETREILKNTDKKMTVEDVARLMKWQIRANSWDEFPDPQKWFAAGEAMVHLEYLASENKAIMHNENNIFYFEYKD